MWRKKALNSTWASFIINCTLYETWNTLLNSNIQHIVHYYYFISLYMMTRSITVLSLEQKLSFKWSYRPYTSILQCNEVPQGSSASMDAWEEYQLTGLLHQTFLRCFLGICVQSTPRLALKHAWLWDHLYIALVAFPFCNKRTTTKAT